MILRRADSIDKDQKYSERTTAKAAQRLNGEQNENDYYVDRRITKNLINHESDKLTLEIEALLKTESEEIQDMISYISTEERNFMRIVYLLHAVACPTVRYKLNTICSHADLQRKLQAKQTKLSALKEECEITPSQWKLLFPDIGKTSSKDFGLKLMRILIFELELSHVKKAEMEALLSLESYVHTLARSNSGRVSDEHFNDYWNDICEVF
ncbi:unnamed protein product [Mytilus coruscus]|uniref:DZIP3-like HEPN domain-containing protein n=1 Tax=Mytilus coruscus TaxID=42192 RepID=A0A6J8C9L0_MYTCO|nr:unnamed protein product [Mytilus coruscus]